MSKLKFSSLDNEQQKTVLQKRGAVLSVKAKDVFTFILYELNGSYIEAMYNNRYGNLVMAKTYKSDKYLSAYL